MIPPSSCFPYFCLLIAVCSSQAGPVNYWRFEGTSGEVFATAENSVPSGAPLTQDDGTRQPVLTSEAPKLPGGSANQSSVEFRQENRTALAASESSVADFGESKPFTVECWIKPRAYPSAEGVFLTILHKRGGDTTDAQAPKPGFQMLLGPDRRIIYSAVAGDGEAKALHSKSEIPLDSWTHLAVSRDSDGKFLLYVNGAKEDESRGPLPASLANDGFLTVGANRFMMAKLPFWEGLIDEVRISDSVLAPEELLYAPQ